MRGASLFVFVVLVVDFVAPMNLVKIPGCPSEVFIAIDQVVAIKSDSVCVKPMMFDSFTVVQQPEYQEKGSVILLKGIDTGFCSSLEPAEVAANFSLQLQAPVSFLVVESLGDCVRRMTEEIEQMRKNAQDQMLLLLILEKDLEGRTALAIEANDKAKLYLAELEARQ